MPSRDFFRGCQAALAVKHYYRATREVAIYLGCMFEVAFPEYHAKYTKAFKAGVWESADPGPWIGRAIVYKLQVSEHVDGLDDIGIVSSMLSKVYGTYNRFEKRKLSILPPGWEHFLSHIPLNTWPIAKCGIPKLPKMSDTIAGEESTTMYRTCLSSPTSILRDARSY